MEDEEVVESVQRGVRSRLYDRGRTIQAAVVNHKDFDRIRLSPKISIDTF